MGWNIQSESVFCIIILQTSVLIHLAFAVHYDTVVCYSNLTCSTPINSSCVSGSCSCLEGFQLSEDNSTCTLIIKAKVEDKQGLTKFAIIFIAVVFTITSTILLAIICCIIYRRNKDHTNYALALSSPSTEREVTEKASDFQHHHLEMQTVPHRDSDYFEDQEDTPQEEQSLKGNMDSTQRYSGNMESTQRYSGNMDSTQSYSGNMDSTQRNDATDGDIDSLNLSTPKKVKRDMFLQQITNLRPLATTFLAMSNEVKNLLDNAKHGNPRTETFKDVVRDLSRVLFILNKRESDIKMAPDGIELLRWAASSMKKYEECHEIADRGKDWKGMTPGVTKTMWIESKDESVFKEAHSESALI